MPARCFVVFSLFAHLLSDAQRESFVAEHELTAFVRQVE
jgi:hypothetical protein